MNFCSPITAGLGTRSTTIVPIKAKTRGKLIKSSKRKSNVSKNRSQKNFKTKDLEPVQNTEIDVEDETEVIAANPISSKKREPNPKSRKQTTIKSESHKGRSSKKDRKLGKSEDDKRSTKMTEFFKEKSSSVCLDAEKRKDIYNFNPSYVHGLAEQFPDEYWGESWEGKNFEMIDEKQDLKLIESHINDKAPILGLHLSRDGELLATFSTLGLIKIWDTTTFELLQELRDVDEENLDEFYVGQFSADSALMIAGGKLKDKKRWSYDDDDNHILPCPIRIFDVVTGLVVAKLEGHEEEILCIKTVKFKQENYYLSTSQDGYIIRWHMDADWKKLNSRERMDDGITCMAFTVSMVPNTGNKYFLGACDEHIRLYDFEQCTLLQTFADIYSSYCDCGKFISYLNQDQEEDNEEQGAYFISRGVELLDFEGNTIASRQNTCTLHKLVFPRRKNGKFELREIRRYKHDE
jgi:WD40 repeat protein